MKNQIIFVITIFFTIFLSCDNSPEFEDRFSIYLLENDTLTTINVEEQILSDIKLKDNPIIQFDDIIGYQVADHKVYLNEKLSYYLGTDSMRVFSKIFGYPFVIIANDERIYLGSFISGISSYAPGTPKILDDAVNNTEKSFIISGAPIYDETTFIDIRNDERILKALGDKIID